jgi:Xaa-Pro aminopeptidase
MSIPTPTNPQAPRQTDAPAGTAAVADGRPAEVAAKLALLREALAQAAGGGAGAIRLRGADWFAWATAGGDGTVAQAAAQDTDDGSAEVLVTRDEACILTDEAEAERLRGEQLPDGFTFHIAPWAEPALHHTYALGAAGGGPVLSDRPRADEQPLPASLRLRRMVLGTAEQARYRALGRDAAEAVSEALRAARTDWLETDLAAAAAHALWRRGIVPTLVLAAGERRLPLFRHPVPAREPLGRRALLSVGARRHGLVAGLTRMVAFAPQADDERNAVDALLRVEATGLDAARPGQSLAAVYHALDAGYRHANLPEAIRAGHQGGIAGYALHEIVAGPSTATGLETGMALALAPGFGGHGLQHASGVRVGDTFLIGTADLEPLTVDPGWPSTTVGGRVRPLPLEAA